MTKLLLALLATATFALAADPFPGAWKLNLEKSKLGPQGPERRKGEVLTIEAAGKDKYQITLRVPNDKDAGVEGKIWIVDGKEHEQEFPNGGVGTMKVERIGELHLRTTTKAKSSQTAVVYDWAVAEDGAMLIATPVDRPDRQFVYDKR